MLKMVKRKKRKPNKKECRILNSSPERVIKSTTTTMPNINCERFHIASIGRITVQMAKVH